MKEDICMKLKKLVALGLVLTLAAGLASCAKSGGEPANTPAPTT